MTAILPSASGGKVTREVAFLQADAKTVAHWLLDGLDNTWTVQRAGWHGVEDMVRTLAPSPEITRYGVVPVGNGWSLVLNNSPRGTDVGMLPSQSARELGGLGIRAVCAEDGEPGYPARILEVFSPDGTGPLKLLRAIVAANDGGRWIFETAGEPLPFEQCGEYERRRKSDRFTSTLLYEYLRQLGVPVTCEPTWAEAFIVQDRPR
jgi:hypothetical protein